MKKIVVPIHLHQEMHLILEYASNLALASNSKISCLCNMDYNHTSSQQEPDIKQSRITKLDYVRIINDVLNTKKVAYEVIITKNGLLDCLKNYTNSSLPHLIVMELSELNKVYSTIEEIKIPIVLYLKPLKHIA